MQCPKCGHHLDPLPQDIGAIHVCEKCGWGRDPDAVRRQTGAPADNPRHISTATWIKLPIFWILSILVCLGPYAAIVWGIPYLAESQGADWLSVSSSDLMAKLNPGYWIALGIYIAIAGTINVGVDFTNLGLGGTWIDNPFSFEDDRNRAMLKLGLLLAPGKLVVITVVGSFQVLRMMITGSA